MPNQNGRNMNDNREQRTYRPQDDDRMMRDREHRDRDDDDRNTERFGGGQSGYGSGRFGDDRAMGPGYRNQSHPNRSYDDRQGMHTDDRFTGRGGEGYWEDRTERSNYNSGYNQGGMGFGNSGGGQPQRSSQGAFRGGSAGAQQSASDYNQGRYPDMYGPDEPWQGQGSHQGYGSQSRWANVRQAGMQQDWNRGPQPRGMQGNYGPDMQRGYGTQSNYGQPGGGNYGQSYGPQSFGGHRGKGPQGYTRSDDRIKETVCEALHDDDHVDASHIEVVVKNGEVILTGSVEDRRQKRIAEDVIERLPGVKDIQNQLRCGGSTERRGNPNNGSAVGKNETEMASDKKHRA